MSNYNEPTFPLYQSLCILPINKLFELQLGKFMFQHKSNSSPKPLTNVFIPNSNIHGHNTRHRCDPHIRQPNTDKLLRYFIHKAPDI